MMCILGQFASEFGDWLGLLIARSYGSQDGGLAAFLDFTGDEYFV